MTAKRDWPRELKALKKKPRELSPAECDELILLLGGTIRPNHRPEVLAFGMNRRQLNQGGIGSVVFSFLENAERLSQLEAEIQELTSPDFMEKYLAELPRRWSEVHTSKMTAKDRANAVRITKENVAAELTWRKNMIESLRPISAKNRAAAERMAVEWFAARGINCNLQKIQNELTAIQRTAEPKLKRLGLAEWRELMAIENERAAKKGNQPNKIIILPS